MAKTLTATDRSALIRLASSMGKGSPERRAILAGLGSYPSSDEDDQYEGALMMLEGGVAYRLQIHGSSKQAVKDAQKAVIRGARMPLEGEENDVSHINQAWETELYISAFDGPDERGLRKLVDLAKRVPGITEVFHYADTDIPEWQKAKAFVDAFDKKYPQPTR